MWHAACRRLAVAELAMRFTRFGRWAFSDTSRKRSAFERKKRQEREALPLFAEQIAAEQATADDEMARRRENWDRRIAGDRAHRAKKWRECRRRVCEYQPEVRTALLAYWQSCRWPADPSYFLSMLHMYDNGRLSLSAASQDRPAE